MIEHAARVAAFVRTARTIVIPETAMNAIETQQPISALPIYHRSIDWDALYRRYPPPDVFVDTRWKWSADRIRAFQNEQFLDLMKTGWGQADAKRIYTAARPSYHAVTVNTLDAIVK